MEKIKNGDEKQKPNRNSKLAVILALVIGMGVGAGTLYLKYREEIAFTNKYHLMLDIQEYMRETVGAEDPHEPTEEQIINAYLSLYGDEYTKYSKVDIMSEDFIRNQINHSSVAEGSGFEIAFNDEKNIVLKNVQEGMPAYDQGLRSGDVITSIDEKELDTYEDAKKIMGKQGSRVKLRVESNGITKEIDFERFTNTERSVGLTKEKYGDTLYVKYESFVVSADTTLSDMLNGEKFDSLIVDLRNNNGGEVAVAVNSADLFSTKCDVKLNGYYENGPVFSTSDAVEYDVPIVLLVNNKTASAAEIFTAIMKQSSDTQIVGENTFGKGVYQNYGVFKKGKLQYTAGYITVGNWECYDKTGIAPDIEVEMDPSLIGTDEDVQLQKALELLG